MKTKSIKSIAALLSAAVILSTTALAGPGPQPQFQAQKVSEHKSVSAPAGTAATIAFGGTKTSPSLTTVSGPHGTTYLYRK